MVKWSLYYVPDIQEWQFAIWRQLFGRIWQHRIIPMPNYSPDAVAP